MDFPVLKKKKPGKKHVDKYSDHAVIWQTQGHNRQQMKPLWNASQATLWSKHPAQHPPYSGRPVPLTACMLQPHSKCNPKYVSSNHLKAK